MALGQIIDILIVMHPYKKLIGDRIYLSPRGASQEELEHFTAWMNDTEVTDYLGRTQQLVTIEVLSEMRLQGYWSRQGSDFSERILL